MENFLEKKCSVMRLDDKENVSPNKRLHKDIENDTEKGKQI